MPVKNTTTATAPLKWAKAESLLNNLLQDKKYNTALMCSIGCHWGLRIGDILQLKWNQITQPEFTIIEQKARGKKKGRTRTLTNSKRNYEIIKAAYNALPVSPSPEDYVFVEQRKYSVGGKPISRTAANKRIRTALEKYAIETKNPSSHTLRKTFARKVYEDANDKGEALVYLMHILNHTSTQITKVYIGLEDEKIKQTYELIGKGKLDKNDLITF